VSTDKKKLLLIEDNDDTLDLLEIFLYKEYDIITAQNGFDALNKAQEESPDCILTDIMMPVMDGVRFYNELKKNVRIANIPVIAITSFIKKANTKSLLNIGFSEVISKPLQSKAIHATIKKVLGPSTVHEK
jgi:CheY-like chemotaxis protein